jgi:hypothetical protein
MANAGIHITIDDIAEKLWNDDNLRMAKAGQHLEGSALSHIYFKIGTHLMKLNTTTGEVLEEEDPRAIKRIYPYLSQQKGKVWDSRYGTA